MITFSNGTLIMLLQFYIPWTQTKLLHLHFTIKEIKSIQVTFYYFIYMQLKALSLWIVLSFSFPIVWGMVMSESIKPVVKSTGFKVKGPRLQFWPCHVISILVWANYLASHSLICKTRKIIGLPIGLSLSGPHSIWSTINSRWKISFVIIFKNQIQKLT